MPGVRCACGNVLFSSLHNRTKLMRIKIKLFHSHLILAVSIWYLMCAKYEVLSILIVPGLRSVQDQNALHKTQQWLLFSFNNIRHNDEIELHCLILIWYWGVGTYGGVEIPLAHIVSAHILGARMIQKWLLLILPRRRNENFHIHQCFYILPGDYFHENSDLIFV